VVKVGHIETMEGLGIDIDPEEEIAILSFDVGDGEYIKYHWQKDKQTLPTIPGN